jgi:hypothetical protein
VNHDRHRVRRVSTTDQDWSIQEATMRAAGCDVIRAEKQSGTRTLGRMELRAMLGFIGKIAGSSLSSSERSSRSGFVPASGVPRRKASSSDGRAYRQS